MDLWISKWTCCRSVTTCVDFCHPDFLWKNKRCNLGRLQQLTEKLAKIVFDFKLNQWTNVLTIGPFLVWYLIHFVLALYCFFVLIYRKKDEMLQFLQNKIISANTVKKTKTVTAGSSLDHCAFKQDQYHVRRDRSLWKWIRTSPVTQPRWFIPLCKVPKRRCCMKHSWPYSVFVVDQLYGLLHLLASWFFIHRYIK